MTSRLASLALTSACALVFGAGGAVAGVAIAAPHMSQLRGPAGSQGPQGLTGATGATGTRGFAGIDGLPGKDGIDATPTVISDCPERQHRDKVVTDVTVINGLVEVSTTDACVF